MKTILTYCLLLQSFTVVFSQTADDTLPSMRTRLVANPSLDLSLGPVFGMHPNLRNTYPKGYYFVEGKASAVVKGLPFKLSFRKSDEDLRFGRASYIKLSFDASAYQKKSLAGLSDTLKKLDTQIAEKKKLLYALEAKWAYLLQKKNELEMKLAKQQGLPSAGTFAMPSVPDLPSVPDVPSVPDPNLPSVPDPNVVQSPSIPETPSIPSGLASLDSLQQQMDNLSGLLEQAQAGLKALKVKELDLKTAYAKMQGKIPMNFLGGIQKMDFGLTSLGKSSMSKNALPIQGFHVQYAGERYFTDVAAGYTLPSQLFSNQAFDQILYNSGNVFNMGDFFQVNSMRFVSSAKVGYGKETGSYIASENYYAGALLHGKQATNPPPQAYTTNLTSRFSPARWKNFSWQNTAGISWIQPDSANQPAVDVADRIALFSCANILFPKLKSSLESSYRRIPSGYDGFTQGIYLKQTERVETIYKQSFSRRLRTSFRISRDRFYLQNALKSSRVIHQAGIDMQLKISQNFVMTGSYSLLQLSERDMAIAPRSDISHLARLGAVSTHELGKNEFTTLHEVSYAQINGFDSTQLLLQANARYGYSLKRWRFGLQAQYTRFEGLTKLYGENLMIQPEIGLKLEHLYFTAAFQHLWSDQFHRDYGMQFRSGFAFSEYVDFDLTMQRFLPTEYVLFIDQALEYQKPFYVKFSVNVHLN